MEVFIKMTKIFKNNFNLLRLLASIQVFYFHTIEHLHIPIVKSQYFRSYPGVIIFFTISGYLIFSSIERNKDNLKQYIINRLGRIYPALWFSTVISIIFILMTYNILDFKKFALYIFGQFTFFQFWTPSILRGYGVGTPNGSLWTIVVELQFYFAIILIYFYFNSKKKLILLAIFSLILNIFIGNLPENIIAKLFRVSLFPYLYNFLIGSFFFKYKWLKTKFLDNKFFYWFVIYNFAIFLGIKPSYFINLNGFIGNTLLAITTLSFAFSFTEYIYNFKVDLSYGIYLYHMIFLNFFIHKFGRNLVQEPLYIISYISLVLLTSLFSYFCIEKPCLNIAKKNIN